jgi:hypothetical protein
MGAAMSFLIYLAVLVVAAGSALFGLDLLTAPLPLKPAVHVASAPSTPNKLEQRAATQRGEMTEKHANRPMTPLYPANPAGTKDVRTVYPPSNETTGTATTTTQAAADGPPKADNNATPQVNQLQPQQAAISASPLAKVEEPTAPAQQAPAQPAVQKESNRCDVQACASAYASFRASDCTYQPYEGPRRVCVAPPQRRSQQATRSRDIDARPNRATRIFDHGDERPYGRGDELRVMPPRPPAAISSNDDDDDYDAPRPPRRVIMIDRGYRPY